MSETTDSFGMLDAEDLRDIDEQLLAYLREHPITPAYARERLQQDGFDDYSRGYVQQRLARLEEHSHVENLELTGLYRLVDDPLGYGVNVDEDIAAAAISRQHDLELEVETCRERAADARESLRRALEELPDGAPGRTAVEDALRQLEVDG